MKMLLVCALALAAAVPAFAGPPAPKPFTVQETGKSYARLDEAVNAMAGKPGATILIQPGSYRQCAVVEGGKVAFRAVTPGTVFLDGGICEEKAALVLRGRDAMVDGIVFQNLAVHDRNGAGIRLEQGNLTVMNAVFRHSEEGILAGDDPNGTIRVDRSTFSGLGRCDGGVSCAHSIYVGHYGKVIVTRTRFERGNGGHYLKVRSARVEATNDSFDDSQGRLTNYMIDLCAGSTGVIADNVFVDGPNKENHSGFIVIAAESHDNPVAGLTIRNNKATMAPGADYDTSFVIDFAHEPMTIAGNQLASGINPFEQRNY
ncbi:MAG: right-handed parallel beta-helix repeat-containing protein [Sphingomonadaceae bacterium]|nr:right-handed parallel beta-helix repeat-containing protein [Sphingomonadaceae bacterium]